MAETIKEFIINMFNDNAMLATFVLALLPIFELRGAIPFGMSTEIWGANALSPISSFLTSFIATSLIVPVVAIIFIPILNAFKKTKLFKNLAIKFENQIKTKSTKIENKNSTKIKKMIGVLLFVAIPLPLTGVYTGTCVAVMLGLNFYETLISCVSGNLIAGLIMLLVSTIFKNNTLIVLYAFLIIFAVLIVSGIIAKLIKKHKSVKNVQ